MQIQKEWLDFLREQYSKGSRIRLTEMKDDPYALSPGSMGTLKYIDDDAQFHISWDNGSGLALRIGEDRFRVLLPEPQTLKFYMPLTAQLYGRDSWGDLEEYPLSRMAGSFVYCGAGVDAYCISLAWFHLPLYNSIKIMVGTFVSTIILSLHDLNAGRLFV